MSFPPERCHNGFPEKQVSKLIVDRQTRITHVEDIWWQGELDGSPIDLTLTVYRSDSGDRQGQFGVSAVLGKRGGGYQMITSSPHNERIFWALTKEDAIEGKLAQLSR
jgi:hypothetical protein